MKKRLSVKIPSTPENRLLFRETLFSASGMSECIGGVILYDETIKQETQKRNPELALKWVVPQVLKLILVPTSAGSTDEKITEGLDGLRETQRIL